MKILAIVGSRRKNGNTFNIVKNILEACGKEGSETEMLFLGDYEIGACTGCEGCSGSFECVIKDDYSKVVEKMKNAEGIIMASPTYWYNVTGDMKIFIDRCYSLIKFKGEDRTSWTSAFENQGKLGIPVAVCEQHEEEMMGFTYKTLQMFMDDIDVEVVDGIKGLGYFEAGKVTKDEAIMEKARELGTRLVEELKKNESGVCQE